MTADPMPFTEPPRSLTDRLSDARAGAEQNMVRLSEICRQISADREHWQGGRTLRQASHDSAFARLLARLETQPVIEQAKGVLMAQSRCSADT
ncbi:MAG: ANTAR domain-containing protein, partial [Acidimicrobiales bacterium]|nr:ANTAR domain-containing protein [Acidimicrobiales bacterium]